MASEVLLNAGQSDGLLPSGVKQMKAQTKNVMGKKSDIFRKESHPVNLLQNCGNIRKEPTSLVFHEIQVGSNQVKNPKQTYTVMIVT